MGLRIYTNVESLAAQRHLGNNSLNLSKSLERLSSGKRINRSADDAAGLAISENIRAKVRGLGQASRNANDGISLIQVAEGGFSEIGNIMIRLRELVVQASSDTIGAQERTFLDKEYQQLTQEIDRISGSTEFNSNNLLGPQERDIVVQVGYNGTPNDTITLKLNDIKDGINTTSLGLAETSIGGSDITAISPIMEKIDNAIQTIAGARSTLGSVQSRLNSAISGIGTMSENMSAAGSRIADADFASETATYTQNKILSQAGLSVLAQANAKPEMALALLRG